MTPQIQPSPAQIKRLARWESAQLEQQQQPGQQPAQQPLIVYVGEPARPPAAQPADKPSFGAGVITTLIMVGIFALAWHLISSAGAESAAFLLSLIHISEPTRPY